MGRLLRIALVGTAVALASCAGGASTTTTAATSSPATTAASTTSPPTDSSPTTAAPTTTVADTTTSTAPTTTVPVTEPPGEPPLPGQIVAVRDFSLALVDLPSGDDTTLVELFSEGGVFRAGLVLDPGGDTLYYSEGYEDFWYSCESSRGEVGEVDIATGAMTSLGAGFSPMPSPNGALVARLYADTCVPDPENPEIWVLTATDTVIVTDENGDDPVEHGIGVVPAGPEDPATLRWVGWESDSDLLVLTAGDILHRVPLGSTQPISEHPVVATGVVGRPVGLGDDGLVVIRYSDDFSSATVVGIDLASGEETELATTTGEVSAGIDPLGRLAIAEVVAGTEPSTQLHLPDGTEVVLDGAIHDFDW